MSKGVGSTALSSRSPHRDLNRKNIFPASIRVCHKSLIEKLPSDVLPIIFQPFTTAGSQEHENVYLAALRRFAGDPSHGSSGWLGHFSLDQMDRFGGLFKPYVVKCRGTSSLIPCGTNSYSMWKQLGWPLVFPLHTSGLRSVFHYPTSLQTRRNRHRETIVTLRLVQQRRLFPLSQS